jgi:hypothetical protein
MRTLIGSVFQLSTAAALFTLQQAWNTALAPLDTQAALTGLRRSLDAMSETLASKLDPAKQAALESMTRAQSEMFGITPPTAGTSGGKAGRAAAP